MFVSLFVCLVVRAFYRAALHKRAVLKNRAVIRTTLCRKKLAKIHTRYMRVKGFSMPPPKCVCGQPRTSLGWFSAPPKNSTVSTASICGPLGFGFCTVLSRFSRSRALFFWQFSHLIQLQRRLGNDVFPLVQQSFYPNHREMSSNLWVITASSFLY